MAIAMAMAIIRLPRLRDRLANIKFKMQSRILFDLLRDVDDADLDLCLRTMHVCYYCVVLYCAFKKTENLIFIILILIIKLNFLIISY